MAILLDSLNESSYTGTSGFFGVAPTIPSIMVQSATVSTPAKLTSVQFYLRLNDPSDSFTPYGQLRAYVYNTYTGTPGVNAVPTGSPYATSDPLNVSSIATGSLQMYSFTFSGTEAKNLATGTYFVAIDRYTLNGGTDGHGGNGIYVGIGAGDDGNGADYASGSGWTVWSSADLIYRLYGDPTAPVADFTATPVTGTPTLSVSFTDTSTNTPTSWSWDFGDTGTSTSQNPSHNYTSPGSYTVTLTAMNAYGSDSEVKTGYVNVSRVIVAGDTTNSSTVTGPTVVQSAPAPPPAPDWSALGKEDEKKYVYKVYKADGSFVGVWNDVKDDLEFTQQINTPGTTTTVRLARSADTAIEKRELVVTQSGETLTDEGGDSLAVVYTTNNTVGSDSDVELNYNVDIYVIYGGFDDLITQASDLLTTESGEQIIVSYGSPSGTRVFSGYIMDYEALYGDEAGVTVTLASHGAELSQDLVRSGSATTVTFASSSLESQLKSILDTNPGKLSYSGSSIAATGVSDASKFTMNTKLEAIESLYERTLAGWYWYVNVADNLIYLQPQGSTPDHTFQLGYHIKSLALRRSIEQIRNVVYFVGAETAGVAIYKKYEDTASQTAWRRAVYRVIDRRYSVATSMQKRADKEMSQFKDPVYVTSVTISSAKYDLESISLGQIVGFRNFNNFIDQVSLQIVGRKYTPSALTLDLGMMLQTTGDMATDLEQRVLDESTQNIPDTPA